MPSRIRQQYFIGALSVDWIHHHDSCLKKQQQNKEITGLSKVLHLDEVLTDPSHDSLEAQALCRLPLGFLLPLLTHLPETLFPFQKGNG